MKHLLLCLPLLIASSAAALPGDVAPAAAPDERVDIGDVLLALSMTVGVAEVDLAADLSPTSGFGSRQYIVGDGRVDVADVLLLLRIVVGLEFVTGGVDVSDEEGLAQVQSAAFAFDGFWTVLHDALTIDEVPPLNVPTQSDCAVSGSITILLRFSDQSIEAMDCNTGEYTINGLASRQGSLLDSVFDADAELSLVHQDGSLSMDGSFATEGGVEFEPGRSGSLITCGLATNSSFPAALDFWFEADLVEPDDRTWPIGTVRVSPSCGPAIGLVFDGSSTAIATAREPSETRTYSINLETRTVTELP